jgi:hypothetical protein
MLSLLGIMKKPEPERTIQIRNIRRAEDNFFLTYIKIENCSCK